MENEMRKHIDKFSNFHLNEGIFGKKNKRIHPDLTSRVKPTPVNQIELYELLEKYDELVEELPYLHKKLKNLEEITISWGMNRKQIKNIVQLLQDLKTNIDNIQIP